MVVHTEGEKGVKNMEKKRCEAQIRAIRRSYAIRAKKKQKKSRPADRKTRTEKQEGRDKNKTKKEKSSDGQLKKYNRIAEEYEKDPKKNKKLSDYAKKGLTIQGDSVNPEILDNVWNVHHVGTDQHPKIVMARKGEEYLISHTTTEAKDKDQKIQIQDGLFEGQKETTYVKLTATVLPKKKLQSKIKGSRVTNRDKVFIYDSVKDRETNKKKYQDLGNKKDRSESVVAHQGSHSRKPKG